MEISKEEAIESTKELSNKAGINSISGKFIFSESEVVRQATFSCHKIDNKFCYGLMLPKEVPIYGGKGKERKIIGREQKRCPAVLTSERELIEPSNETENQYKIKYTSIPTELKLRLELNVIDNYLKNKSPMIEGKKVFNSVKDTYKRFLYFQNPIWFDIHSLWDMGTYFFELFNSYPLMELTGLSGTAKSKIMNVSRFFTLNPTSIMVNPSEASLFRTTHSKRPTKYIDEAEKLFMYIGGQWQSSPVVELINGSYTKGSTVPRVEKIGNEYHNVEYGCYSPTMIGSITGLRGATETRAITHITTKAPDSDKRGEIEVEDYVEDKEFQQIRNELYLYAFDNWKDIETAYKELKVDNIKKRDFQLWKPLLAIAKVIDSELYERVLAFAEKISTQKRHDFISEGSLDYRILEQMKIRLEEFNETQIRIKTISGYINNNKDKDKVAEKTISNHLDKLGFKEFRGRDRESSFIEIDKSVFETIVATICPTLSTHSPHSPPSNINHKKSSGEGVVNSGESNDKNVVNVANRGENGEYSELGCFSTERIDLGGTK